MGTLYGPFSFCCTFLFPKGIGEYPSDKKNKAADSSLNFAFLCGRYILERFEVYAAGGLFCNCFYLPLLVTALSVLILGANVSTHRWGVVIVGLLGVLLVMRTGIGIFNWVSTLPYR
jgi:hypothetical protein